MKLKAKTYTMKIREQKPDMSMKVTPQERAYDTDANLERPKIDKAHCPNFGSVVTCPSTGMKFRVVS